MKALNYEHHLGALESSSLLKTIPISKLMQYKQLKDHKHLKNYRDFKNYLKIKAYDKDEIIHFDGDHCSTMDIILKGRVAIERIAEDGDLLTIADFRIDDILGGNLIFSQSPFYPMTVTAKTNVIVACLHRDLVLELCSRHHDFLLAYLVYISDHTLLLGDKLKHYVKRSMRDSLLAYFQAESLRNESTIIPLQITKKALADRLGVQRTSLSRELQKMKNDGLIDYDRNTVTLLKEKL